MTFNRAFSYCRKGKRMRLPNWINGRWLELFTYTTNCYTSPEPVGWKSQEITVFVEVINGFSKQWFFNLDEFESVKWEVI